MNDIPTIINLWGFPGSGKTTLVETMRCGQAHLLEVPLLREAVARGFGFWNGNRTEAVAISEQTLTEALQEVLADHEFLVGDNIAAPAELFEASRGQYHIVRVLLVVPLWMLRARRQWRYALYYASPEEKTALDIGPDVETVEKFEATIIAYPGTELMYVDASDYPLREVTEERARDIACGVCAGLPEMPGPKDYQTGLRIRGRLWGCAGEATETHIQRRLDSVLPADLTGKTVLDVGANHGLFSWETLHRGAAYVVAVENDPTCIEFLRRVRDVEHLPLSTCHLDMRQQSLPIWRAHTRPIRYDIALLLNVLHWSEEPGALLASVLAACEECIIETPFAAGMEPHTGPQGSHHDLRCLPPWWIEQQARANGFRVAAMRNSPIYPGYRMIFNLVRATP